MNQPGTVDLPRPEQVSPLVDEALRALGTIDILVNNADTLWAAPAEDHSDSGWREVMGLNIDVLFFLAREIGKRVMLPKRSGKILNVASLVGLGGSPSGWKAHLVSYHARKAAVIGLIPICIKKENKTRSRRQCCSTARRSNAVIVFNANWNKCLSSRAVPARANAIRPSARAWSSTTPACAQHSGH